MKCLELGLYVCRQWNKKDFISYTMQQKNLELLFNSRGVTSGAGTAYPSGAPEFTPVFLWGSCYSILSFICLFCWSFFVLLYFCPFVLFLLATVLSVPLQYTDSYCPFGIFKLYWHNLKINFLELVQLDDDDDDDDDDNDVHFVLDLQA